MWRPGVDPARARRRAWQRTHAELAGASIVSAGCMAWAVAVGPPLLWEMGLLVVVTLVVAAAGARLDYLTRPNRDAYRVSDFSDLPHPSAALARGIVRAVWELHRGPAIDWLDRDCIRAVHSSAWNALVYLDTVRTALLDGPEPVGGDEQIDTANQTLHHVLTALREAAEQVAELNNHLIATDATETSSPRRVRRAATEASELLLAHVTAVQDVLPAAASPGLQSGVRLPSP